MPTRVTEGAGIRRPHGGRGGRRWSRNSTLPFWPVMGDGVEPTRVNPTSAPAAATSSSTRACTAGSRMTPLRTSSRPASNCGFTSATTSAPSRRTAATAGRIWRSEMNETSMTTMSTGPGQIGERQMPGVEVLDDDDARIVAQPPVELPVADVERDDARGAALQQHVGEAAGRGADVERLAAGDGDAEGVERVRELQAAAADVGVVRREQRRRRRRHRPACRPWSPARRPRSPGRRGSTRLGALARGREAACRPRADRGGGEACGQVVR